MNMQTASISQVIWHLAKLSFTILLFSFLLEWLTDVDRGFSFMCGLGFALSLSLALPHYYATKNKETMSYIQELEGALSEWQERGDMYNGMQEKTNELKRTVSDLNEVKNELKGSLEKEKGKVRTLQGMLNEYRESEKELGEVKKEMEESRKELEMMLESIKERERNVAELEVYRQKYRSLVNSLNRAKSIEAVREKQAQL